MKGCSDDPDVGTAAIFYAFPG